MSEKQFAVLSIHELRWPSSVRLPTRRFRLFVAADVHDLSPEVISDFASAAFSNGMVYFCAWGLGCERFHDIVDEVAIEDAIGLRKFVGPLPEDVVMTTSHEDESLEDALEFFACFALPTARFQPDSGFRLVVCVDNDDWAATAQRFLESQWFGL